MTMLASLDRRSPVPYHVQIRDQLRRLILEGRLDSIQLSDVWLGRHFGVSRMTVRQALAALVAEGLIKRERGRGTLVVTPAPGDVFALNDYVDQWQLRGDDVSARIVARTHVQANELLAAMMRIRPGRTVGHFRRLRLNEGSPVCLDDRYLPLSIFNQLDDEDLLLSPNPTWKVIQEKLGTAISRIDTRILATAVAGEEAHLLEVAGGSPVLERQLDFYDSTGRVVMTGPSWFRPDRFIYRSTIRSQP